MSTSKRYNLFSAAIAFILWGAWAYFVNLEKGKSSPLLFAVVQGIFSFIMTLVIVGVLQFFLSKMKKFPLPNLTPAILTTTGTGSLLVMVHYFIGTPNLIKTVIAPITVSFLFCLYTVKKANEGGKI